MKETEKKYFQDYMPGNVCFGCGTKVNNPEGLHIASYWEGDEGVCHWQPQPHHHGWPKLLNGGMIATVVDCHTMSTAMAHAYKLENRELDTLPHYKYATGTLTIKYLKPTSVEHPLELRAKVTAVKGKKTTVVCSIYSQGVLTGEAEVIAFRVFDSSDENQNPAFL